MHDDEIRDVVALFRAYWPEHPSTEVFFAACERLLCDLEVEVCIAALDALAVEQPRFAPGPGLIRQKATTLMIGEPPDAARAWREVRQAIAHVGHVRTPSWSSPAIGVVVDALGGWQELCLSQNSVADRAHFMKLYAELVGRELRDMAMPVNVQALMRRSGLQLLESIYQSRELHEGESSG